MSCPGCINEYKEKQTKCRYCKKNTEKMVRERVEQLLTRTATLEKIGTRLGLKIQPCPGCDECFILEFDSKCTACGLPRTYFNKPKKIEEFYGPEEEMKWYEEAYLWLFFGFATIGIIWQVIQGDIFAIAFLALLLIPFLAIRVYSHFKYRKAVD